MIFRRLHLTAFGKFQDREIGLSDGLNLIYGENEAGKSTLHGFIRGMLFGFKKPLAKRYYTDDHARFRPWQGKAYAGFLEYETEGRTYRIERNLERDETAIYDSLTGDTITDAFRQDKRREYDFAERHLGLSSTVFDNTVCVRQLGVATTEDLAGEVAGKLANLSRAGTEDISVQTALSYLQKNLDQIGTTKAPTKPLGRLTTRIDALTAEAAAMDDLLRELRELEQRLFLCRESIREGEQALQSRQQALSRCRTILAQRQLNRARVYEAGLDRINTDLTRLEPYSDYPAHLLGQLTDLAEALRAREEVKEEIERAVARLEEQKHVLEQQRQVLAAYGEFGRADSLTVSNSFTLYRSLCADRGAGEQDLASLRDELAAILLAARPYSGFAQLGQDSLHRVMELNETISRLEQSETRRRLQELQNERNQAAPSPGGRRAGLALVLAAAGAGLAYYTHSYWPLVIGLILAAGYLMTGHRQSGGSRQQRGEMAAVLSHLETEAVAETEKLRDAQQELSAVLQTAGVKDVREFGEKNSLYQALGQKESYQRRRIAEKERLLSSIEQRLDGLRDTIAAYLDRVGLWQEDGEPMETGINAFNTSLQRCLDTRRELTTLASGLSGQQAGREEIGKDITGIQREIEEILAVGKVSSGAEFRANCARYREYTELVRKRDNQTALLQAVLQGREINALAAEVSALPEADDPEINEAKVKSLQEEVETGQRALAAGEKEQGELEAVIETRLVGWRSRPEIEEELAAAREQQAELERESGALKLAADTISEISRSIHREFAPLLNQRVSEAVRTITSARYQEVKITEQIEITTTSPESGMQVQISGLSAGTADQFYLAARLAIADLVTGRDNLPLILDDCFVHYDEHRLANVLTYLGTLAGSRQILLFSCRRREEELLREMGAEFNYIALG